MSTTPPPTPDRQPNVSSQQHVPTAPPQYSAPPRYTPQDGVVVLPASQSKTLGIVSVVLGGLALLLSIIPLFSFLLAISSVVCAIIALVRRMGRKLLPLLGIGLSVLGLVIATIVTVVAVNLALEQGGF
ncbi:hypothetical protein [Sinomonas sp. ASV322]|uniref:hypothetical protein n=1 Tax=Sinomonas sp. ASV322 TaxID=3041920 RepID=UPI0027DB69C3|nr:hypothetical protein [Sinomonas sp. ASV322]MDQ4503080.1 hypothetical protein [Sinomonas sp. ASV322]